MVNRRARGLLPENSQDEEEVFRTTAAGKTVDGYGLRKSGEVSGKPSRADAIQLRLGKE